MHSHHKHTGPCHRRLHDRGQKKSPKRAEARWGHFCRLIFQAVLAGRLRIVILLVCRMGQRVRCWKIFCQYTRLKFSVNSQKIFLIAFKPNQCQLIVASQQGICIEESQNWCKLLHRAPFWKIIFGNPLELSKENHRRNNSNYIDYLQAC